MLFLRSYQTTQRSVANPLVTKRRKICRAAISNGFRTGATTTSSCFGVAHRSPRATQPQHWLAPLLVVIGLVAIALPDHAAGQTATHSPCPAARTAWEHGDQERAATEARACLRTLPGDLRIWYELARSLAASGDYQGALTWTTRALRQYPNDMDWRALHIRVLMWSGHLDDAQTQVAYLSPEAMHDPDTARMVADLALWRGDHASANKQYSAWLSAFGPNADVIRNRATTWRALGDNRGALNDMRTACTLAPARCEAYRQLRRALARSTAHTVFRVTNTDSSNGWINLIAGISRQLGAHTVASLSTDYQRRFRQLSSASLLISGGVTVRLPLRMVVRLGGAYGLVQAPLRYSLDLEPGIAFPFGLELYLRLWQLSFQQTRTHIASPAALFTRPTYELRMRYFLTRSANAAITHSVSAEAHYTGLQHHRFIGRVSSGQGTDVDDRLGAGLTETYWELSGAVRRHFGWRHALSIGYSLRVGNVLISSRPGAKSRRLVRHATELSYQARF